MPWVSTPIAASTWLGVRVEAVHAEPLAMPKPRRSSSVTRASPSTYRQENVSRWGSRSTGSPTTSTSGSRATSARIRSMRAWCRGFTSSRSSTTALQGGGGGQRGRDVLEARPLARRPGRRRGTGCASGRPCGPAAPRRPGGPPHLWADAAATAQPSGNGSRPAEAPAATKRGTPGTASATAATGWSVPTSWLALCTATSATGSGALATAAATSCGADPTLPVDGDHHVGRAGPGDGMGDRGVLHGGADDRAAVPRPPAVQAQQPAVHGLGPAAGEGHLVGTCTEARRDHLAGVVQQQPCGPTRAVQAPGIGVPLVERGQQRLAGGGVQGLGRRGVPHGLRGCPRGVRAGAHTAEPTGPPRHLIGA